MPLPSGTHIGPYSVTVAIGAGGMGEVYRARDTRLERDVALKVLPENVSGDNERLLRLQREARTLAALNHPNIAHVYGLENANGVTAFAMELVDGPTLEDRIATGAIPLDEAARIARQIADALETAHEQGIVHRDLKPANVKIRPDGTVKVLDFGLARAVESAPNASASMMPTITSPAMTAMGVIMGTAAYMSPEQAKGQPVDRRADIWAFGVVFAEMLTGKRMFAGDSVSETIASVIKDPPAIPDAPPAIRQLIARCLQRDQRARLRDIGEARIVLEDPASMTSAPAAAAGPVPAGRPGLAWALISAVVLVSGIGIGWLVRPAPPSVEVPHRTFTLPADNLIHSAQRAPVISPDGTKVAYASLGPGRLWVRDLATSESRSVLDTDAQFFSWSPDSTQLVYVSSQDGRLMRVRADGGTPTAIAALRQSLGSDGATAWTADGSIVFTSSLPNTGLQRVAVDGGDLAPLLMPVKDTERDFHDLSALPDGKGLLYVVDRVGGAVDTIAAFAGGSAKRVLQIEGETIRAPVYASTGHILFQRTSNNPGVWAVPFSLDDLTTTGDPFLVVPQGTFPSVSRDGTLVYMPPVVAGMQELVWIDRTGAAVGTIGRPLPGLNSPALSPDGRRVAATALEEQHPAIWVFDTTRDAQTRLTFGEGDKNSPTWSPGGDRVFFTWATPPETGRSIAAQPADGTGQSQVIVKTRRGIAASISPDGRFVVYTESGPDVAKMGSDIWYASIDGSVPPRPFISDPQPQQDPRFSPDGRYVAYLSFEAGRPDVFVKAFPGGEGKWQVSVNAGVAPRWSRRGTLLFLQPGPTTKVMEATVSTSGAFVAGTPREVLDFAKVERYAGGWDVIADASRFVVMRQSASAPRRQPPMTVIQNWSAGFKNRRP
jgi:serine/threonine protein kinase